MKETSYLHHLTFSEKLKNSFIGKFLANPRFLVLLLAAIIGLGSNSFIELPRRLTPEIKIPIVIVSTVLPGANPQDVESLVTKPIEESVSDIEQLNTTTSSSNENISIVTLEFSSGVNPDKARSDVQGAIDSVDLPEDAISPKVQTIDFENTPVWTFALIGKGDVASLNRFSKTLKDELEALPSIDTVSTGGLEEREITILIDQAKLATYGISPTQLASSLTSSLKSFPIGVVTTDNSVFSLSIDPTIVTIGDLRDMQINVEGITMPLSQIATITERSKPNQYPSYFATPEQKTERAITFNVYKTQSTDIDKASKDAEAFVEKKLESYDGQFSVRSISNSGEQIDDQFYHLIRDFIFTIVLVFIVLFLFLGLRQAIVSLVAVPLTFLISFTVMNFSGTSLNFLSMFSLLLSLGLLVDDTIVVISAMTSYYRAGKFTPYQTGILVWKDFIVAILTTTLTTVFAFLPLLITSGIIGEFIKSIPIVVSSTLIASFFVAMVITLPLMIILLKPQFPKRVTTLLKILLIIALLGIYILILPKGIFTIIGLLAMGLFLFVSSRVRKHIISRSHIYIQKQTKKYPILKKSPSLIENGLISFDKIGHGYKKIITNILFSKQGRRTTIIMVIIFSVFSYLLLPLGFVKNEFFPKSDEDSLSATFELPSGTNADISDTYAKKLLEKFRNLKDVSYVTATVGQGANNSYVSGLSAASSNLISFSFVLKDDRSSSSIDFAQMLRNTYGSNPDGTFTVAESSSGPPAGADIQINLYGQDLTVLDQQAEKIVSYLKNQPGVTDIGKSVKPGTSKIVFIPDNALLSEKNVSTNQIGLAMRTFTSGFTLDSANLTEDSGNKKEDITLRTNASLQHLSDVSSISIPTSDGDLPLLSLGKLELRTNPTQINREDGERVLSVTATAQKGYNVASLNKDLEQFATNDLNLPQNYTWKTGGVNEENQKSVNSILQAMIISFVLIIITMVVQFSSFRKAIIVMLVIPLSISGVFIIFSLTQTPLSFPALIGVLALFGIVVKNSILIVDKISANQRIGMDYVHAIADGAASRLEPIALTSLAAIMGLIPITLSDPLWRGLGGAIIAGLTFSGTIMLFFIPVVYYFWFKPQSKTSKKKS